MAQKTPLTLSSVYRLDGDVPLLKRLATRSTYFFEVKKYELSEHFATRCLELNPQHFWMLMRLAKLRELSERLDEAAARYKEAIDVASGPVERAFAHCGHASVLVQRGKAAEAELAYLQAIEERPDYPYAYTGLALLLEGLDSPPLERIAKLYRQAVEIDPQIGSWAQSKLAEIEKALEITADALTEQGRIAKPSPIQLSVLFGQHRLAELLEALLRDHQIAIPYCTELQQVFAELKALPPGHFTTIEAFYLHVADGLDGSSANSDGIPVSEEMALLASTFYERALAGHQPAPAGGHIRCLRNLLQQVQPNPGRLRKAVIQAVLGAGDDPGVLTLAAKAMKLIDRPGVARLLLGQAMEIDPKAVAAVMARPGEEAAPDAAWLELSALLDLANRSHAKKFGSVEKWLETEGASPSLQLSKVSRNPRNDDKARAHADTDAALSEFFALLGEHPVELLFDLAHYAAQGSVPFADLESALVHYFETGWREKRGVHAAIDDDHVRRQLRLRGIDTTAAPLLLLFLRHETALGLSPNALFDATLYRNGARLDPQASPWLHYVLGGWRDNERVSPYFDTTFFARRCRHGSVEESLPPLLRYFCKDPLGDANFLFHAGYYVERYKDSLCGKAPLAHYLSEGAYLGFAPNPFFEPAGRSAQERIDYLKLSPAKV